MYDFEYQMNTYERVLYEVGQAGMTEDSAISLFDIHAALKNHFGSISISKQNFKNTVHRKEYFSKTDILGAKSECVNLENKPSKPKGE